MTVNKNQPQQAPKHHQPANKGLIIVFFGAGKGKTSAALGVILRMLGCGGRVLIVQFGKNQTSGEEISLKKRSGIKFLKFGLGFVGILGDQHNCNEHLQIIQKGVLKVMEELKQNWQLIVLDEVLGALKAGLIKQSQIKTIIQNKAPGTHLILTGRYCPGWLKELADTVTEMKEIKHPYRKGKLAVRGIDY